MTINQNGVKDKKLRDRKLDLLFGVTDIFWPGSVFSLKTNRNILNNWIGAINFLTIRI